MDETKKKEKLKAAVEALFANQPNMFEFTSETGQTEWNLAHHLANEIHNIYPGYNCDLDVTKPNIESRHPAGKGYSCSPSINTMSWYKKGSKKRFIFHNIRLLMFTTGKNA